MSKKSPNGMSPQAAKLALKRTGREMHRISQGLIEVNCYTPEDAFHLCISGGDSAVMADIEVFANMISQLNASGGTIDCLLCGAELHGLCDCGGWVVCRPGLDAVRASGKVVTVIGNMLCMACSARPGLNRAAAEYYVENMFGGARVIMAHDHAPGHS